MDVFAKVINNVRTTLVQPHSVNDGELVVHDASKINIGSDGWGRVTLIRQADAAMCIFKFTGVVGNRITGLTPIEGTSDIDGNINDTVEMRITAGHFQDVHDNLLYTTSTPVTAPVGGIPMGSTFNAVPVTTLLDQLLHPFQPPAFTSFSITGAANQEVGQIFSGPKVFNWNTSNSSNIIPGSIQIAQAGTVIGTGLGNSGPTTLTISATLPSPGSVTWSISGTNIQSAMFSASTSMSWYWRVHYGTHSLTSLSAAEISSLNSLLGSSFSRTYSLAAGGYKYICFPTSFGNPSAFKDASTQLSVAMADASDDPAFNNSANGVSYALVSVTNMHGRETTYKVYRSKNILGGSIDITVS